MPIVSESQTQGQPAGNTVQLTQAELDAFAAIVTQPQTEPAEALEWTVGTWIKDQPFVPGFTHEKGLLRSYEQLHDLLSTLQRTDDAFIVVSPVTHTNWFTQAAVEKGQFIVEIAERREGVNHVFTLRHETGMTFSLAVAYGIMVEFCKRRYFPELEYNEQLF